MTTPICTFAEFASAYNVNTEQAVIFREDHDLPANCEVRDYSGAFMAVLPDGRFWTIVGRSDIVGTEDDVLLHLYVEYWLPECSDGGDFDTLCDVYDDICRFLQKGAPEGLYLKQSADELLYAIHCLPDDKKIGREAWIRMATDTLDWFIMRWGECADAEEYAYRCR